jgi:hypothetical protein
MSTRRINHARPPRIRTIEADLPIHFVVASPLDSLPMSIVRAVDGTFGLCVATPATGGAVRSDSWEAVATVLILAGCRAFWFTGPAAERLEDATDAACTRLEDRARARRRRRSLPADAFGTKRTLAAFTASVDQTEFVHYATNDEAYKPFEPYVARVVVTFDAIERRTWFNRVSRVLIDRSTEER